MKKTAALCLAVFVFIFAFALTGCVAVNSESHSIIASFSAPMWEMLNSSIESLQFTYNFTRVTSQVGIGNIENGGNVYDTDAENDIETEYGRDGKITKTTVYDPDGRLYAVTEYDENGKPKTTSKYNEEGNVYLVGTYEHYENGNVKAYTVLTTERKLRSVIEYNEEGKKFKYTEYGEDGNVIRSLTYLDYSSGNNAFGTYDIHYGTVASFQRPDGSYHYATFEANK